MYPPFLFLLIFNTGPMEAWGLSRSKSDVPQIQKRTCGSVSQITAFLSGRGIQSPVDVPWHVSITRRNELVPDVSLPGLLISPSLVLVRAYHFNDPDTRRFIIYPWDGYRIAVGTRNFGDPAHFDQTNSAQIRNITHIRFHPGYKIGSWTVSQNDFVLFHLSENVNITDLVEPVCLPHSSDYATIENLRKAFNSSEELSLTGWNRNNHINMFLRLKIQSQETCRTLWMGENETNTATFNESRIWCAWVGKENNHNMCIHNNVGAVGAVRLINGSYYVAGIVKQLYSSNRDRQCLSDPAALYYFDVLSTQTFSWIEDNMRCGVHNFTCSDGQCIPIADLCDRSPNCRDSSDEDPDYCRGLKFCKTNEFGCGTYGDCVPMDAVCNGTAECVGGEDEEKCEVRSHLPRDIGIAFSIVLAVIVIVLIVSWTLHHRKLKRDIRNLTKEEIEEFINGRVPSDIRQVIRDVETGKIDADYYYINDPIQSLPWRNENEISMKNLAIGQEINRGRFGIVFRGTLKSNIAEKHSLQSTVDVAVKTHIESVNVMEFKALLCELKIQAYLGQNDYVLKFHGACTQNIKKREVYMVVEYCPNGNLQDFLIANRKYFVQKDPNNCLDPFDGYVLDHRQFGFMNNFDLLLWSTQICCGMEFLASQNVVHGDLAARNVLLTESLNVKICDFGLSRKFGGSGIYVKPTSHNNLIAWRGLAIETLKSSTYSEKSDVWAFGITLTEVYSLGDEPYSGTQWNDTFVADLESGKRLPQPEHASDELYKLMSFCWRHRPEDRPTFKALRANLTILLQQFQSEKCRRRLSDDMKASVGEYMKII